MSEARRATHAANAEAEAARNGIGLVKLMGRDSGFIAAYTVLVDGQVNFCLVPEVPFGLEAFLSALGERLKRRGHALVVVAEGAGQDLMAKAQAKDASGNVRYGDIGVFLRDRISEHFERERTPDHPEVHRPELHDPQRAGDSARLGLLPAARSQRRARGDERPHEPGRQLLEPPLHARADPARGVRAQEDRPRGGALVERPRLDRAAAGHALMRELGPRDRVGHYEILEAIGAGGMGKVLRARDLKLGRDVALKVLPAEVADQPERLARFRREAQILASLNHPRIGAIHGLEEADGILALSLELVEGEDLAQRLARGALPVDETLAVAGQIAAGLEYAHERGVVHRDLKPANVKTTPDGGVKILDFGLAKAYDSDPASASGSDLGSFSPTLSRHMSAAGIILGTAAYMSPEQARGRPVDKRADIWSFGVVLYEMLTGQRLFTGETVTDVLAAVVRQEIAWDALPPATPPALRQLVRRCLERDAARRLRDIGEARIAIEDAIARAGCGAPRRQPGRSGTAAEAIGSAVGGGRGARPRAGARGLGALAECAFAFDAAALERGARSGRHPATSRPATRAASMVLSPDGRTLVFVGQTGAGTRLLHVRRLEQALASPLPGTEGASHPFLSPDSRWIGFFADNKLKKVAVEGGPTVTLCDAVVDNRGGSWSPDGTILFAVAGEATLRRISAGGGAVTELPTSGEAAAAVDARWPQILPGGRAVIFTSGVSGNYDAASLVVQRLPDGPRKIVHKGGYQGRYLRSGHLLYMRGGALFAAPFDLERLEVKGASMPVLEGVASNPGAGGAQFAASDSGALVFLSGGSQVPPMPIDVARKGRASPASPADSGDLLRHRVLARRTATRHGHPGR